jgi:serine phosphatase RsbU (regulator of sigma subunit)
MFEAHPDMVGLPVVDEGRPIGLINRNIFMQSMARPFHREIYLNKSCIAFMDKEPMMVEADVGISELSFAVIEGGAKTLADGFIVTADGQYVGVGLANDVFAAIAALQAEKNRQVMESIEYAQVIQNSLSRASREGMRLTLPDHFLLWAPRDMVSGDFYFFQAYPEGWLLALFDCTGHGVPGAFMTLIMASFLQGALGGGKHQDPAALLGEVNRKVKLAMGQVDHSHEVGETDAVSDDGMDAAFCWFDTASRKLSYAGAHMPIFLVRPGMDEVHLQEGDRQGVGYSTTPMDQTWNNHVLDIPPGTNLYLFTDGYLDQLGGERRIAYGKRRLCAKLLEDKHLPMPAQRVALLGALMEYQGQEVRRDDVTAIGVHFQT